MATDLLQTVLHSGGLNAGELAVLRKYGQIKTFPKHTLLINEGDDPGPLFIVLIGKVKVFLGDERGKEVILGIEDVGGCVGEIALLDSEPRSASAVTMEKTQCRVISKEIFQKIVRENPDFALGIILALTKRVRSLIENVRTLALRSVYQRVIGILAERSEEDGEVYVMREKLTHRDIADMVGASREMVSRVLKELTKGGYISTRKRQIVIHRTLPENW